jgi:hypothetical protein
MRVAPICECVSTFRWTLAGLWDHADAVVRLRITGHDPDNPELKHIGTVLSVSKQNPNIAATRTLTFRQVIEPGEVEPYAVGQEFVLFLVWSPAEHTFVRMSFDRAVAAFAIEKGRIHSAPFADYAGTEAAQLVNRLASFAAR